jgi:hypothetical protein
MNIVTFSSSPNGAPSQVFDRPSLSAAVPPHSSQNWQLHFLHVAKKATLVVPQKGHCLVIFWTPVWRLRIARKLSPSRKAETKHYHNHRQEMNHLFKRLLSEVHLLLGCCHVELQSWLLELLLEQASQARGESSFPQQRALLSTDSERQSNLICSLPLE